MWNEPVTNIFLPSSLDLIALSIASDTLSQTTVSGNLRENISLRASGSADLSLPRPDMNTLPDTLDRFSAALRASLSLSIPITMSTLPYNAETSSASAAEPAAVCVTSIITGSPGIFSSLQGHLISLRPFRILHLMH